MPRFPGKQAYSVPIDGLPSFCFTVCMKKSARFLLLFCILAAAVCPPSFSQEQITTVDTFFSSVSDVYAGLSDYSANIAISYGSSSSGEEMTGRVIYKSPNLMRIDFTSPADQTIVFDGNVLTVYLPAPYNAVLTQAVEEPSDGDSPAGGASLATPGGLSLMRRYYSIAYETGPDPVPLEEGSRVRVIALSLTRRSTTEMFRTIRLLVDPRTRLIRRIQAETITGATIRFTFSDYSLNQGIPDTRFVYDSPSSANVYDNFLFNE